MPWGHKDEETWSLSPQSANQTAKTYSKWQLQWYTSVCQMFIRDRAPASAWWNQGKLPGEGSAWGHTGKMRRHCWADLGTRRVGREYAKTQRYESSCSWSIKFREHAAVHDDKQAGRNQTVLRNSDLHRQRLPCLLNICWWVTQQTSTL